MAAVVIDSRRSGAGAAGGTPGRHLELYRPGTTGEAAVRDLAFRPQSKARTASAGAARTGCSAPARSARPNPAVYRRRRLLAGGLLLLAVAAVLILAQLIQAGIGGGPLTTTGAAAGPGMIQAGTTEYVVQPGDTLWSIAARLAPGRDERPLVDELAQQTHGASLYPGQVIVLPGR